MATLDASTPINDTATLLAVLDARGGDIEALRDFDESIWRRCGAEAAILVTDLSGFTRLTRKRGILHFLSLFRRFQLRCEPAVAEHGGTMIKHDADDLVGVFPRARDAIEAGLAMQRRVTALNEGSDEDDIIGLCVGVSFGRMLLLADNAFGDPVNVAFKLGEEVAEPGELLVDEPTLARARNEGLDPAGHAVEGPRTVSISRVALEHLCLRAR